MKKVFYITICLAFVSHLAIMYFITGNGRYFDYTGNWFPYLEIRPYYQTIILSVISFLFVFGAIYIRRFNWKKQIKMSLTTILIFVSVFFFYLSGQFVSIYKDGNIRVQFSVFVLKKAPLKNFNALKNQCFDFSSFHDSSWWGHWPCAAQSECLFIKIVDSEEETFFTREYRLGDGAVFTVFKGFGDSFILQHNKDVFKNLKSMNS